MLTLANINSLNWFTARSKEHYQLTLAERNSHFKNHTTTQRLICAKLNSEQGALPAHTCQQKLTQLVYHKQQGALTSSHLLKETPT